MNSTHSFIDLTLIATVGVSLICLVQVILFAIWVWMTNKKGSGW